MQYEIFKNALEAKEIVMKLYEVEPVKRSFFDGILGGKWIKVVELNRSSRLQAAVFFLENMLSNLNFLKAGFYTGGFDCNIDFRMPEIWL